MTSTRRLACIGGAAVVLSILGTVAQGLTTTQIVQYTNTAIVTNVTTPSDPPPEPTPYPITAAFAQFDTGLGTLNQVTLEYNFSFTLVINIPAFGGGSGGGSIQGNMLVNNAMFGGDGTGTGYGGGGPAVFEVPFGVPMVNPPRSLVISDTTNPPAFAQFIGTGTVTFLWDAAYRANWDGSPGGWVDLLMNDTSYVRVIYDYTPACHTPFADADDDQDVDQDDFAEWQKCYLDPTAPATIGVCYCLDTDQSTVVDDTDLQAFLNCWSGPNVQFTGCTGA